MPRLQGKAFLVRYADDFVMGFSCEQDARAVLNVLPKRFGKYGLALHPDKTRLVPFHRPALHGSRADAPRTPQPGTFELLGFTHFWGRSRRGFWTVRRKTAQGRLSRALRKIAQWCRLNRHLPLPEQHRTLVQKMRGHYAYYGLVGNGYSLRLFLAGVQRLWKKWLARRRRRGHYLSWEYFPALDAAFSAAVGACTLSRSRHVGEPVT